MSWYPEENSAMSSTPYNHPTHAGVYVSDLENRSLDAYNSSYAPAFNQLALNAMDSTENSTYYNNVYEPVQYYHNSYNGQFIPPFPPVAAGSGYIPGVPLQSIHFESQNFDPVSHNMMPNPNTSSLNLGHSSSHPRSHNNQRNHIRDRGRSNNYWGSKRGHRGSQPNSQFGGKNSDFNNYSAYGRNTRSHNPRGHQTMSFQARNRAYDNGNNNQREGYQFRSNYQYHNVNGRQQGSAKNDTTLSNHDGAECKYDDYKKAQKCQHHFEGAQEFESYEVPVETINPNNRRVKEIGSWKLNQSDVVESKERKDKRSGNLLNKFESKNDSGVMKERGNAAAGQKSYYNKGARPKQQGRLEDQSVDKDESQRGALTEQLSRNAYECMVCCEIIKVESAIWSCQNCYHVFHLHCTKKWAHSSVDKDSKSWRCPGCQNESSQIPSQYRCFCGRQRDPQYVRGEIPHSCGETCRKKKRGNCKHPCTILCHPGPCPPCSAMVNQPCDCGKQRKSMRCSVASPYKCDTICSKLLPCGEHKCSETCHSGECKKCTVSKMLGCYCRKKERQVFCGTLDYKMISYSCEETCGKTLSCGNHVCEEACHPGDCAVCNSDPKIQSSCCCGKTTLEKLSAVERHSCLDPIPVCELICDKPMACGPEDDHHLCGKQCHEGDCGPCNKETTVHCQCGRMTKDFPCETAITFCDDNPFKCQKRCGKKKTCGRHKCSDNCCVKDYHICEYICGQKLSCGIHKCKELCHRGNCKRCLETSFEELACFCGATVLEPPIPCGTKPPDCQQLCTRPQECGHPVRHNCHMDDDCAPCTELTEITCMGGHMVRRNIPCHMKNISCGMPCNRNLSCGMHKCQKVCHKGTCLSDGAVCTQSCVKPRPACGHPCGAPCHDGDCPSTFCKTEIVITCRCGNRSTKIECHTGGDQSGEIAQFQRLTVQSFAESGSDGVDMAQFSQTKPGSRKIDCDTTCAVLERNKRMALALEIRNPDLGAKLGNASFTDFLKDFGRKNSTFASGVEKALGDLVQTAKKSPHQHRSHSFPSMNRDQRRFVHELAEFYGCQTQSYDFEPNKNVVATAYREKCWLPNVTLTQLLFKDQTAKAPPPLSGLKSQGVTFTVLEKKKPVQPVKDSPAPFRAWETVSSSKPASDASIVDKTAAAPVVDYFDFSEK